MTMSKIVSPEIGHFVTEWANKNCQNQDDVWELSDCWRHLHKLCFPDWAKIIFFNDPELKSYIPPWSSFQGPLLPYPFPVFEQNLKSITSMCKRIPQNIKTYFLIAQKSSETLYDCFEQASRIAEKFNHLQGMQYIIAFCAGEHLGLSVSFFTSQKLLEQQQKLSLGVIYRQLTKYSLPESSRMPRPTGKLLVFESIPHNREILEQYLQLVLLHKNLPFILGINGSFFHVSDAASCLIPQIRHCHENCNYINNNYIQWQDSISGYTAICLTPSSIKDTEILAGQISRDFFSQEAQVLIWDCELIPRLDSPIGLVFQKILDSGKHIWLCLHDEIDNLEMVWQEKISVIRKSGRNGQQLFVTKHTMIGAGNLPRQYRCSAAVQNEIFGSKYADLMRRIRTLSAHGEKEKDIARQLNLSIYTLRQIKRRAGIRVNAPPKRKRRTGMDTKIAALRDTLPVEEIARRLKTSPSYIKRRFKAQDEARQKSLFEGSQPPPQQFIPYD